MWSCNATTNEHESGEVRIVNVLKGTRGVPALNYVTSLVYFVWHRLEGDHADGMYEIPYVIGFVVWSTAILTHLPVLPFHIIIGSNVRFNAHDFYRADVGL